MKKGDLITQKLKEGEERNLGDLIIMAIDTCFVLGENVSVCFVAGPNSPYSLFAVYPMDWVYNTYELKK